MLTHVRMRVGGLHPDLSEEESQFEGERRQTQIAQIHIMRARNQRDQSTYVQCCLPVSVNHAILHEEEEEGLHGCHASNPDAFDLG